MGTDRITDAAVVLHQLVTSTHMARVLLFLGLWEELSPEERSEVWVRRHQLAQQGRL